MMWQSYGRHCITYASNLFMNTASPGGEPHETTSKSRIGLKGQGIID